LKTKSRQTTQQCFFQAEIIKQNTIPQVVRSGKKRNHKGKTKNTSNTVGHTLPEKHKHCLTVAKRHTEPSSKSKIEQNHTTKQRKQSHQKHRQRHKFP
jgi:hypothetical protein